MTTDDTERNLAGVPTSLESQKTQLEEILAVEVVRLREPLPMLVFSPEELMDEKLQERCQKLLKHLDCSVCMSYRENKEYHKGKINAIKGLLERIDNHTRIKNLASRMMGEK